MLDGFIFQASALDELWVDRTKFTVAVHRDELIPQAAIVLIVDADAIVAIGRLRRGGMITSLQKRVAFERVSNVAPISLGTILEGLRPRLRPHAIRVFQGHGIIADSTWEGIRDVIKTVAPSVFQYLEEIGMGAKSVPNRESWGTVALEKDAVALALSLASMSPGLIPQWRQSEDYAPFLQGLDGVEVIEDRILENDFRHLLEGWWPNDRGLLMSFSNGKRRLDVLNVNRESIERTLGVDLIYYNATFQSYVMVQYKRMVREGTAASGRSRLVYRPTSDGSLLQEIERMGAYNEVAVSSQIDSEELSVKDPRRYRLHTGLCYLKFCEPDLDFRNPQLSKGMYLPLDHYCVLSESPLFLRGERGGGVVTYDTVDRYMDSTQFIHLVAEGWIGSSGIATRSLTETIQSLLARHHSVFLANDTGAITRPERHRKFNR